LLTLSVGPFLEAMLCFGTRLALSPTFIPKAFANFASSSYEVKVWAQGGGQEEKNREALLELHTVINPPALNATHVFGGGPKIYRQRKRLPDDHTTNLTATATASTTARRYSQSTYSVQVRGNNNNISKDSQPSLPSMLRCIDDDTLIP
jgi:hypothetical protein